MHDFSVRAGLYFKEITSAVRTDLLLYATALIYLVCGAAYLVASGHSMIGEYDIYLVGCIVLCCLALPYIALVLAALRIVLFSKGRRSLAWRTLIAPRRVGRFVAGTLLLLVVMMFFEAMFTSIKASFSSQNFFYDAFVADFDKALHFGRSPAHWLAFLRYDWLLRVVETNYDAVWGALWLGTLYWCCVSPRAEHLRVRFVMTFMLAWVLIGNVIASQTLTAGPALYGLATGDHDRFSKLASFLASTPNATSATQQYLWSLHEANAGSIWSGISAFPSMHVAITTVCALFLAEVDKRVGIAAWIYVAIIMLSSVYLGWHYAVDGYAAVLLSVGIYWAIRRGLPVLGRLRFRRPASAQAEPGFAMTGPDTAAP